MAGDKEDGKGYALDGVEYPRFKNLIAGIESRAPYLIGESADALKVRKWFRANEQNIRPYDDPGLLSSRDWIDSLLGLAYVCVHHRVEPSQWERLSKKEKQRKLNKISHLCESLINELDTECLPFDEPKIIELVGVRDLLGSMRESLMLNSFAAREGVTRLYDEQLVDVLRVFGEQVGRESEQVSTSERKVNIGGHEKREFARAVSDFLSDDFDLEVSPNEIIAAVVELRFPGGGVSASDVKDWLR